MTLEEALKVVTEATEDHLAEYSLLADAAAIREALDTLKIGVPVVVQHGIDRLPTVKWADGAGQVALISREMLDVIAAQLAEARDGARWRS